MSCAIPPLSRRRRQRRALGGGSSSSSHNSDDESEDHHHPNNNNEPMSGAAKRFQKEVRDTMANVIRDNTGYDVVVEGYDDYDGGRRRHRSLHDSSSSSSSSSNNPRTYRHDDDDDDDYTHGNNFSDNHHHHPHHHGHHGDEILLIASQQNTNLTKLDIPVGSMKGAVWWMYTISFYTIEQNFTQVNNTVMNATTTSIESGDFFDLLRVHFPRLVAVSLPGDEVNAELTHHHSSSDDSEELTEESEGIDVNEWDPSRWVGLGLFAFTLSITLALTRTAKHRRKKVQEQEDWGVGLGTETDINKLLTYGWEYDGQEVHAFDKSKLVYRDDDSMLIGGALPQQQQHQQQHQASSPTNSPTERSSGIGTHESQNTSSAGRSFEKSAASELSVEEIIINI